MKFGVFDIEAENWINFRVLGFFDREDYKVFYDIKKFLSFLDSKKFNGWRIYAHFGGRYDFLFLLDYIINRWKYRLIERHGRLLAIICETPKGTHFTLADSYAILPFSLKALSESFDITHKKKEFEFEKGFEVTSKLLSYLENDVKGLYEILSSYFAFEYIDDAKLTIASQALDIFKQRFFSGELVRMYDGDEMIFRKFFYHGGRVEVYKGFGKNLNLYDINSLFPYAMLQEMPCGDSFKTQTFQKNLIGFYKVNVLSTPNFYVTPYLQKFEDRKSVV